MARKRKSPLNVRLQWNGCSFLGDWYSKVAINSRGKMLKWCARLCFERPYIFLVIPVYSTLFGGALPTRSCTTEIVSTWRGNLTWYYLAQQGLSTVKIPAVPGTEFGAVYNQIRSTVNRLFLLLGVACFFLFCSYFKHGYHVSHQPQIQSRHLPRIPSTTSWSQFLEHPKL